MRHLLTGVFNNSIVALNHAIGWQHLQSEVHSTAPANTEDLKERISCEVNLLDENPDLVIRVTTAKREQGLNYVRQEMAAMWRESVDGKELRLNIFFY